MNELKKLLKIHKYTHILYPIYDNDMIFSDDVDILIRKFIMNELEDLVKLFQGDKELIELKEENKNLKDKIKTIQDNLDKEKNIFKNKIKTIQNNLDKERED